MPETLTITASTDFRGQILPADITSIIFSATATQDPNGDVVATFDASQFGPGLISNSVAFTGAVPSDDVIIVRMANAGAFTAAGWTLSGFSSGFNFILFFGSTGNDTITGSSEDDFIEGQGGIDTLSGGNGNDTFVFAASAGAGTVTGGNGTSDTIRSNASGSSIDFTSATITGVERLEVAGTAIVNMRGDQVRAGAITTVTTSGAGPHKVGLNGNAVDLTGVSFFGFENDDNDVIGLVGTSGNDTLIGSSSRDLLQYVSGVDTLRGEGGDDEFHVFGTTSPGVVGTVAAGTVINGGAHSAGDAIVLVAAGANLAAATITGVEKLFMRSNGTVATLAPEHFGAGAITLVRGFVNNSLTVNGSTIDLSGVTFEDWSAPSQVLLIGTVGNDTITGSGVADRIRGRSGTDTLVGGEGDDVFIYTTPSEFTATESVSGNGGTDTFELDGAYDLTARNFSSIEGIRFTGDADSATLTSAQANALTALTGNAGNDSLTVNGSNTDLADVGFTDWSASDSITLNGFNTSANTIIGSSQRDLVLVTSSATNVITGGGGADELNGGNFADTFRYAANGDAATGEIVNGGGGTDRLRIEGSATQIFTSVTLNSIEVVEFTGGSAFTFFDIAQIGTGKINSLIASSSPDQFAVQGANVDLTTLGFTGWDATSDFVFISGFGGPNGANTLVGTGQRDFISGGAGADTMNGGGGNDTFEYATGSDILAGESANGGTGTDTLRVKGAGTFDFRPVALTSIERIEFKNGADDVARATFSASQFSTTGVANGLQVLGNAALNQITVTLPVAGAFSAANWSFDGWQAGSDIIALTGTSGADTITGSSQNDTIDGLGGADTMAGGGGNDLFFVDNAADGVVEGAGGGTADRVLAALSYTLAAGVQVEIMSTTDNFATTAINLTGNELGNTIFGNAGANTLDGKGAADSLFGFGGNDFYFVDNSADAITEGTGEGTGDRVLASVSYTLGAGDQVEIMSTTDNFGTTAVNLTGNEFGNTIFGNAGANTLDGKGAADSLIGFGGNDFFFVDNAADDITERTGEGTGDRVFASVSYRLGVGDQVEIMSTSDNFGTTAINLTGNEFGNTIFGNAGANTLDGQGAADLLIGFGGNDFFFVDNPADDITERTGEGTGDRVFASVTFSLGAGDQVEIMSTTDNLGTTAIDLTGNEFANNVFGNAGSNVLNGKAANDTLAGFGGADFFLFDTSLDATNNVDRVVDFSVADDTIRLENAVFTALTTTGVLAATAFRIGSVAVDDDDRMLYDDLSGALIFDQNGSAPGGATQFATLTAGLALTNSDFVIV